MRSSRNGNIVNLIPYKNVMEITKGSCLTGTWQPMGQPHLYKFANRNDNSHSKVVPKRMHF